MENVSRWAAFLFVFLCVYGSFHLYLLIKVKRAFYVEGWTYILLLAILLFLLLAPIQARVLEGQGYATLSWIVLWIGFVWMGLLFLFVCLGIPLDVYHFSLGSFQQVFNADWTHLMLSRRQNVTLLAALAGGMFIYGAYAAYEVQIRHHVVHSTKLPESIGRIRIVQISDLHVGPMTYPGRLNPVLSAIRAAEPDILVSTGDLVDGMHPDLSTIAAEFKNLPAPMGKFAVTGNHEFYMDIQAAVQFTQSAGFTLLRGSAMEIADHIIMAGVDDPAGGPGADATEARMLKNLPEDRFAILLKHRPVVAPSDGGRFDLQLSGHTHKGQIFPFRQLVKLVYPQYAGWYSTGQHSHLYVNRGTGTWGPPIRILAPAEITIIDLVSGKGDAGTTVNTFYN
jgi:uncharacterized protein